MEKLIQITAVAAPLPIDNLDTDQIIPKQFLRGIDRQGLQKGCFYNMRFNSDGSPRSECVFNRAGFETTQIIVAGPNYGCGSSREHAVWSQQQMGIRVVIAPSFGEIFYSNCFNNGLLAAKVSEADGKEILSLLSDVEPTKLTVDVEKREIRLDDHCWSFAISDRHQRMILEGLDMVESTLADIEEIKAFRDQHEKRFPWMAKLPAIAKAHLVRCGD
ncbi:MAG: 3-isopropylmalate dehydratase small subunit [Burkholderiaceae bacterium]|nr:3-isopropylmalate dehydratase small subunit [Burkholderiaceae bacterium]